MSALIPLLLMAQATTGQGTSAGDLSGYYNRNRETTFTGIVTGKTKGQAPGYAQGVSILVRTGKRIREVELGPAWFVGRQSSTINLNDKVKVTGTTVLVDKREQVTIARQISRGNKVLTLLDPTGNPLWVARRSSSAAMGNGVAQRMDHRVQGTVGQMKMYNINGEQYAGYVINTPNGPVDAAFAPSWYWNNQPTYFNIGDNLTLYGDTPPLHVGTGGVNGGVVLVNSASFNGGGVFLISGGFPVYGGFRGLGRP